MGSVKCTTGKLIALCLPPHSKTLRAVAPSDSILQSRCVFMAFPPMLPAKHSIDNEGERTIDRTVAINVIGVHKEAVHIRAVVERSVETVCRHGSEAVRHLKTEKDIVISDSIMINLKSTVAGRSPRLSVVAARN